jgi:uncharacterized membrane protein YeaQ/YmgE (transglycosylase-associated protein family)
MLFGSIVGLIIIGIVAGFIARAIVPGGESVSLSEKVVLGIAGSFLGGLLVRLLLHQPRGFVQVSSWIASIVGSVIVLLVYMQVQERRA